MKLKGGHEVKIDVVPLAIDEVLAFGPDVIVINMVRRAEVLGSAIHDFFREVDGAKAFKAMAECDQTRGIPIVLTALAVKESEVPVGYHYDAFVEIPQKVDYLLHTVDRLVRAHGDNSDVAPR